MTGPAVLVADDDDLLRRLVQRVLEADGVRVLPAADGDQALAAVADPAQGVTVVVLDLVMPPYDGDETVRRMLAVRPGIGLLLTSGLPPDAGVSALLAAHGGVFLRKPFAPQALRSAVADLLARGGA